MQATLAAIVEGSREAIIGRALDNTIIFWNAAAERMFGYRAAEVIGRDALDLLMPPELRHEALERRKLREAGHTLAEQETVRIAKDGRRIDVAVVTSAIKDKDGHVTGFATMLRDITERKQVEDQVRQLAFCDALTRLPNRRLLYERLSWALAASKRSGCYGAVIFLDLDNFKPLNAWA